MDRIFRPNLNQVNNVSIGQQWSVNLDIGPAYRYIDVIVTMTTAAGLTAAAITDFMDLTKILVNGKSFREFLGTEANKIYTRYSDVASQYSALIFRSTGAGNTLAPNGLTNGAPKVPVANDQTTCIFRIYFEEPWRKSWSAGASRKLYTAWPPKPGSTTNQVLSSLQLQSLIPATANNLGATGISVLLQYGTDSQLGPMLKDGTPVTNALKWYRYPGISYNAAGDLPLNNLVKYDKGKVLAILEEMDIFSQSAGDDVGRLQVWADSRLVYDATSAENGNELLRHNFNPAAWDLDQFCYIADANDIVTDGLFLSTPNGQYINTFTATATLTAAAGANKTLVVISQVVGPLD